MLAVRLQRLAVVSMFVVLALVFVVTTSWAAGVPQHRAEAARQRADPDFWRAQQLNDALTAFSFNFGTGA